MNLYFVRHGLARHNLEHPEEIPVDPVFSDIEPYDTSLTPQGEEQADLCGKRLAKIRFDAILVSPTHRTLSTAAGIARNQKDPPALEILPDLVECGTRKFNLMPQHLLDRVYPNVLPADGKTTSFDEPDGDGQHAMWLRACRVVDYVKSRFKGEENVLLVSHGAFMNQYLVEAFLELPEDLAMRYCLGAENCCITKLHILPDRSKFILMALDETGHLGDRISRDPFDL